MNSINRIFQTALLLCMSFTVAAADEFDLLDLLDRFRNSPPVYFNNEELSVAVDCVEWRMKRANILRQKYVDSRNEIEQATKELQKELQLLFEELPQDLGQVDQRTRSELAGEVLRLTLKDQLELAARQKTVLELQQEGKAEENTADPAHRLKLLEEEQNLEMLAKELEFAQRELEEAKRLNKQGMVSAIGVAKAKLRVAKLYSRMELSKKKFDILKNSRPSGIARMLVEERLAIVPVQARIESAKEFFDRLKKANQIAMKADQVKRNIALWEKDLEHVASQMMSISREVEELKVFQSLLEEETQKRE